MALYGIDLASGEEYITQFHGARHLLDLARLAGVNIHVPVGCGLLRDPDPYPDRWESPVAATHFKKRPILDAMIQEAQGQYEQTCAIVNQIKGQISILQAQFHSGVFPPDSQHHKDAVDAMEKQRGALAQRKRERMHIFARMHQCQGERNYLEFCLRMFVWGDGDRK